MSTTVFLTDRDQEILQALVQKVRLFSLRQTAAHWWDGDLANTRRRLKALAATKLLKRLTVQARKLPPIQGPVCTWQPKQPTPHFGQIAYQLQSRWVRKAVRPLTAYIATERAAQLYGGRSRGELKNPLQATHDLGVAAVWLRLHRHTSQWAGAWCSEDLLAHTHRGEKVPDAFLLNNEGQAAWVIEFGGSYDAPRVQAFHDDCLERAIPYQIW
jgi:hypothetical protein